VMDWSALITCRQQLWEALCEVSCEYPHMKDVVWRLGFYCPGGLQPGGQPHSAVCLTKDLAPVDMECIHEPCCKDDFLLEDKHKSWFKVCIIKCQQLSISYVNSEVNRVYIIVSVDSTCRDSVAP